jgi:hypothetical protein
MFERTKKINGHEYRYLVKSVREDGKIKQKVIKYLGKVEEGENIEAQGCDNSGDPGAGR